MPLGKTLGGGESYFKWADCDACFYNGEAVLTEKLAPLDWKLPSPNDWSRLKEYVGENASALKRRMHGAPTFIPQPMKPDSAFSPEDCFWKEKTKQPW